MSFRDWLQEFKAAGFLTAFAVAAIASSILVQSDYVLEPLRQAFIVPERGISDNRDGTRATADKQRTTPSVASSGTVESLASNKEIGDNGHYANENLAAQLRMAKAAERSLCLSIIQTIIGLVGTAAVIGALFWTIKGTKSAIAQSNAAIEANNLLRITHVAEIRPWLTLDVNPSKLFYNVNGLNLTVIFTVSNIGHSPARNVWIDGALRAPAIGIDSQFNGNDIQVRRLLLRQKVDPIIFPLGRSCSQDGACARNTL